MATYRHGVKRRVDKIGMGLKLLLYTYKLSQSTVMAKVLPIVDVLGYDGHLLLVQIKHSNMKHYGYVGFHNGKRLVILTCL